MDSTLISERFANAFIEMLNQKGCCLKSDKDGVVVEMKKLKNGTFHFL